MEPNSKEKKSGRVGKSWLPSGFVGWQLTIFAFFLTLVVCLTAFYMLRPTAWNGAGIFGFTGLSFSIQIFFVSILGLGLAVMSGRLRVPLAEKFYYLIVILTLFMAVIPNITIWNWARKHGLSLSIINALIPTLNSRGGPQLDKTVIYSVTSDGTKLALDVWPAKNVRQGELRAAIIRVHGGSWVEGTRSQLSNWNDWFNELGYVVFDVDYRMPPAKQWKNINEVADVKCAIGWVADHAKDYGIDTARISLTGFSAGGNLALLAAYSMGDSSLPASCPGRHVKIRCVINFYGPADLIMLYNQSGSADGVQASIRKYIGTSPLEDRESYQRLSPINYIQKDLPPTIILQGENDRIVPVNEATDLDAALARTGVPHELYLLPWTDHGFDASWNSFATQIARDRVRNFLHRYGQ